MTRPDRLLDALVVLLTLALWALFVVWATDNPRRAAAQGSETPYSGPQSLTEPRTAPRASGRPLGGSARLTTAHSGEPRGGGSSIRAGGGDLSLVAVVGPKTSASGQEAGGNQTDGAGPTDSPVSGSASSASLDLRDYAVATPALKPLASDCRLPCYGIARVGPASWYRDWRYGPGALYAAIPGYVDGSVTSVVVCTFPGGRANCDTFPVTDVCNCLRHTRDERVVDLSPAAFAEFGSLSAGLVMVQVTVLR